MKNSTYFVRIALFCLTVAGFAAAQNTSNEKLITGNSAGELKIGMTVAEARRVLKGYKLERTSDGEGIALIGVIKGRDFSMLLYAGEQDPEARINEHARIEQIEVLDKSFKTAGGIHPGMTIEETEQTYGKLREIWMTEIESREYATFSNQPKGLDFKVFGRKHWAGVYSEGEIKTAQYSPDAYIASIIINGSAETMHADNLNRLITADSAGDIKLGMTVAEARKALSGAKFNRISGGDGVALVGVEMGGEMLMTLYAGEEDPDAAMDDNARIEFIEVWDARYRTGEGVHPEMEIKEAEKIYGPLKEIVLSEIEAREFATFSREPEGLQFRVFNQYGFAGIYSEEDRSTTRKYNGGAFIYSIQVVNTPD